MNTETMNTQAYLHEIFRAQLALYRHHLRHREHDEAVDDVTRAETMMAVLMQRFPVLACQQTYEWFKTGLEAPT